MERPGARRCGYASQRRRTPGPRETRMEEDDSKESKGTLRPTQISQVSQVFMHEMTLRKTCLSLRHFLIVLCVLACAFVRVSYGFVVEVLFPIREYKS